MEKIATLKSSKIDTIGIIERKCESMISPKCGNVNFYLLWKNKGRTFIQKINKCETESIKIDSTNYFFTFYYENKQKIEQEELKMYKTEDSGFSMTDHYCESIITFFENDNKLNKTINSYLLEIGEEKNINFKFNNNLKIVELDKNTRKLLKRLFN
ncbi:hypothetical protein [Flavobacterium sp. J27]|uniref:hypothetical protein n=1 Tax=Flavobacterium sp. J27 TaxID=2060419 RepID=UPI001031B225|nr:hypothetical protein [Flavobacterium sp. J27]